MMVWTHKTAWYQQKWLWKTLELTLIIFPKEETNTYSVIVGGESEDVHFTANSYKAPMIYATKTVVRVSILWEPVINK
jgi:hypothetical protein